MPEPSTSAVELLQLPPPQTTGGPSLARVLEQRRSSREFSDGPLTEQQLSQLLWAGQGITAGGERRAAPSSGALYPLELYVISREVVGLYRAQGHRLQVVSHGDVRAELARAALDQSAVAEAAVVFAITVAYFPSAEEVEKRTERYALLEAGHIAQNILLEASALELAAIPIGAFRDQQVQAAIGLANEKTPLYLVAVGRPG